MKYRRSFLKLLHGRQYTWNFIKDFEWIRRRKARDIRIGRMHSTPIKINLASSSLNDHFRSVPDDVRIGQEFWKSKDGPSHHSIPAGWDLSANKLTVIRIWINGIVRNVSRCGLSWQTHFIWHSNKSLRLFRSSLDKKPSSKFSQGLGEGCGEGSSCVQYKIIYGL